MGVGEGKMRILAGGLTNVNVSKVNGFSVGAGAQFDINDNKLIVNNGNVSTSTTNTCNGLTALLQNTRIVSPMDGVVVGRYVDPGEAVSAGTAMIRVADLARMRVEAEVDEFDAGRIEVGAAATLRAEGYSDRSWPGRVEEIPDVLVERRLKPKDPGRFSDTRVLLVKIALLDHVPLRLGERVEVEIAGALEGETARPEAGRP